MIEECLFNVLTVLVYLNSYLKACLLNLQTRPKGYVTTHPRFANQEIEMLKKIKSSILCHSKDKIIYNKSNYMKRGVVD